MGFEQPEVLDDSVEKKAPETLLEYEKWWNKTYGREPSQEEVGELVQLAKRLAQEDTRFHELLSDSFMKGFVDSDQGLEETSKRKWALIGALSTYGKEFGLKVD